MWCDCWRKKSDSLKVNQIWNVIWTAQHTLKRIRCDVRRGGRDGQRERKRETETASCAVAYCGTVSFSAVIAFLLASLFPIYCSVVCNFVWMQKVDVLRKGNYAVIFLNIYSLVRKKKAHSRKSHLVHYKFTEMEFSSSFSQCVRGIRRN